MGDEQAQGGLLVRRTSPMFPLPEPRTRRAECEHRTHREQCSQSRCVAAAARDAATIQGFHHPVSHPAAPGAPAPGVPADGHHHPPEPPPTRRQRGRASAVSEIKAAALDELRLHGARGVTMRGVARAIDMTPSGLYRYFDDHGALLAALCVDAHDSLRATLEQSRELNTDDDAMTQWFRGSVVMRQWALDHVDEYALVVGPRLSGVDPGHPDLVGATVRLMSIPVHTVAEAIARGDLVPGAFPAAVTQLATGVPEPGPGVTSRPGRSRPAPSPPRRRGLARGLRPPDRRRPRRRLRRLLPPGDAGMGLPAPRTTPGWRSRPPEPTRSVRPARPGRTKKIAPKKECAVGGGGAHFYRRPQIAFG